jgi:hypothetical protein
MIWHHHRNLEFKQRYRFLIPEWISLHHRITAVDQPILTLVNPGIILVINTKTVKDELPGKHEN